MNNDKKTLKAGDEVAVIGQRGISKFTSIDRVRTRLGKVTGYTTTDGEVWTSSGTSRGSVWDLRRLELATPELKEKYRKARRHAHLLDKVLRMTHEDWDALPTDDLAAITGIIDRAKKP